MRELAGLGRHVDLSILFYEHGLENHDRGETLHERAYSVVRAIGEESDERRAEEIVISIIEHLLRVRSYYLDDDHPLIAALRIDGFERDGERLVPTTPAPAALGPELSALEQQLEDLAWNVAKSHYEQAHQSYVDGRWEASNGQLRSFLENLIMQLGAHTTGSNRDNAPAALQDLRNSGGIDDSEYHTIRSFWNDIQDNGPHQGLSEEQEALFRLHVGTAVARYLLHKLEG